MNTEDNDDREPRRCVLSQQWTGVGLISGRMSPLSNMEGSQIDRCDFDINLSQ